MELINGLLTGIPFLDGILIGLILMFFLGPSFFFLIGVGVEKGFQEAAYFALGIILSDLLMVLVIFLGLRRFFQQPLFQGIFSLVAGLVIFLAGLYYLQKNSKSSINLQSKNGNSPNYMYTVKGFGINVMNPFTFSVWVGVLGTIGVSQPYTQQQYSILIAGMLGTILCADLLKAYFANQLGNILNERILQTINTVLGVIFVLLSLPLLHNWYQLFSS